MNSNIQMILSLLGGLVLFIYGMTLMSSGLQKIAGDRMRKIIGVFTKNPVIGVIAGALVTAVIQSSSATTVMVVGFVSAGLLKLPQAISIILGANIGTTITAQLIAFKIGEYAWIFVVIGFAVFFFIQKEKFKNIGETVFAFGLLFVGINIMSMAMKPLAQSEAFSQVLVNVSDNPMMGVFVGTVLTGITQASAAIIAVLQNLASSSGPDGVGLIDIQGAIPILLGTNIGTTITALLASIGASLNAKRAALAHTLFNLSGTILFMMILPLYTKLVIFVSPSGEQIDIISRQIANAHLFFNLIAAICWLPFIFILVKIVTKLVRGGEEEESWGINVLDYKVLETPIFALHLAKQESLKLGNTIEIMITSAKGAFLKNAIKEVENVKRLWGKAVDLEEQIVSYLSAIYALESLSESNSKEVSSMMLLVSDLKRIGDHCINISEFAEEKISKAYDFSDTALAEINVAFDLAEYMYKNTLSGFKTREPYYSEEVLEKELQMNELEQRLRRNHMRRLTEKLCSPEFSVTYIDMVHNIEKIGDYCTSIIKNLYEKD